MRCWVCGRGRWWRLQIVRKRSSIIDWVTVASVSRSFSALRRAASERVLDRLGVIEAAEHRLAQGSRELVVVQDVREVGERPRWAGHRDAAVDGAVLRREPRALRRDRRVPPTVCSVVTSGLNSSPRRMPQKVAALR